MLKHFCLHSYNVFSVVAVSTIDLFNVIQFGKQIKHDNQNIEACEI